MSDDHCFLQNFFKGLTVKINSGNDIIVEGKVEEIITKIDHDSYGIFVKLETGEIGNTVEIIQTDNEKKYNKLISNFNYDLQQDESDYVEFKETWAYPVNPEMNLSEITKSDRAQIRFYVAKTIAAFANSDGGTLYVGIQDRTKNIMGLDRDFKLLDEGKQDSDGLGISMKSILENFFQRGSQIWESVSIKFIKINEKDISVIVVKKSKFAFVLKFKNDLYFYVRTNDSSSPKPDLNSFLDYWSRHILDDSL
tara:strand:+ start:340 stop:1095 length:756 start_codon:yes stop_codon:yes gene_type:complete